MGEQVLNATASLQWVWLRTLVGPLIVSSLVVGAAGLEPMRALGSVLKRTVIWMAASGLLAVLVAGAVVGGMAPSSNWTFSTPVPRLVQPDVFFFGTGNWAGLVLISLGFAFYRNQIEEGRGRLIARFCQATYEMLQPLLEWTVRVLPLGVFVIVAEDVRSLHSTPFWALSADTIYTLRCLLLGWFIYGLLILVAVWALVRVRVYRCLPPMVPALGLALASGSVVAAFPLTYDAVQCRLHVSNRVGGVVLSVCTALQREGMALGWVIVTLCQWRCLGEGADWKIWLGTMAIGWLIACGAGALTAAEKIKPLILLTAAAFGSDRLPIYWSLLQLAIMGGAALSVLSHTCVALAIAKGQGEYWVPGPVPDAEALAIEIERQAGDV